MSIEPILVTPEQAAQKLGVGRDRIYRLMANGELPSVKIARSRRIPVDALRAYVKCLLEEGQAC
jgi:excisionase family DNA binding protein